MSKTIPSLDALGATPAADDLIVVHDTSASYDKKVTIAELLQSSGAAKVIDLPTALGGAIGGSGAPSVITTGFTYTHFMFLIQSVTIGGAGQVVAPTQFSQLLTDYAITNTPPTYPLEGRDSSRSPEPFDSGATKVVVAGGAASLEATMSANQQDFEFYKDGFGGSAVVVTKGSLLLWG